MPLTYLPQPLSIDLFEVVNHYTAHFPNKALAIILTILSTFPLMIFSVYCMTSRSAPSKSASTTLSAVLLGGILAFAITFFLCFREADSTEIIQAEVFPKSKESAVKIVETGTECVVELTADKDVSIAFESKPRTGEESSKPEIKVNGARYRYGDSEKSVIEIREGQSIQVEAQLKESGITKCSHLF